MFCSHCGTQITEGANFCNKCGAKVGQAVAPASPAPAAKPRPVTPVASVAGPSVSTPSSSQESRSSKGALFAVAGVAVVILAGAGVYFGTDLLQPSTKPESKPTVAAPAKVMEAPRASGPDAPKPPVELLSNQTGEGAGNAPATSGGATPGTYQTTRPTAVHEAPSASAKVVANIDSGVPINVVGSNGEWLEVRSKTGKPPGFVRSGDATLTEPSK